LVNEAPPTDRAKTHLIDLKAQFTELVDHVNDLVGRVECDMASHQSWHDMLQSCKDRLTSAHSQLVSIDTHGDRIAVHAKLDLVQVWF